MSQIWKLCSLPVLVASLVGCQSPDGASDEGRLDVVIRPDSALASTRPIQGSFVLHAQDGRFVNRLPLVDLYETLSVALPQGVYLLEWQPQLSFESAEDLAARTRQATSVGAATLAVAVGRVTTVNVRAALTPSADAELAALDDAIPSVEILIARH